MFKISKLTDQAIRWEELLVTLHLEWHKLRMRSTKTRPTKKRPSIRRKSILTKTVLPLHLMAQERTACQKRSLICSQALSETTSQSLRVLNIQRSCLIVLVLKMLWKWSMEEIHHRYLLVKGPNRDLNKATQIQSQIHNNIVERSLHQNNLSA